jgi:endonuclease YncB( thermonuclease family)
MCTRADGYFFELLALLSLFVSNVACGEEVTHKRSSKFIKFQDAEYVSTSYEDGDSFRLRIGEEEQVFRLYYVDCPEADTRFTDRNEEQATYFGITPEQSLEAGKAAKDFVRTALIGKKLTVFTRWASALGSTKLPRYYAIIEVENRNLADMLVENGLARLHGKSVTLPDGTKIDDYLNRLIELERLARENKRGAWQHSVPAASKPSVEEERERFEFPRWAERLGFAALGAAAWAALGWLFRYRRSTNTPASAV